MRASHCLLVLVALAALAHSSPVGDTAKAKPEDEVQQTLIDAKEETEVDASARTGRDFEGGGGHGGGGGHHGGGGGGGGHHGGGGGGGGGGHHDVSGGYQAVGHVSNHIGGGGSSSYGAPAQPSYAAPVQPSYAAPVQPSYAAPVVQHQTNSYAAPAPAKPAQQTGYYYYYYPVQIQDSKKEGGFMDKMKKLFEPMMYPWTAMMDYFGYGEDYDYDYDYDSYGSYARSMVSRVSDYVPWDAVNEVGNVVTQDQCIEFFMCQLGTYGRGYNNLHLVFNYLLPDVESNSYTRSFKDSMMMKKTDCLAYSCPIVKRVPLVTTNKSN